MTQQHTHLPAFQVMLKPRGAICNLDCAYCFYLDKEQLYPDSQFRMSEDLLENYTRQIIDAQQVPEVTFAWQGGEPLLMGLDFFQKAIEFQQKYTPSGMRINNSFQTNGTLLDDAWCRFFQEHHFLIGLSIDGPPEQNTYRIDKSGQAAFERTMHGAKLLQQHRVEFNTLTCVHAANADHPREVYHFLRDEVKSQFMQFIPIIEVAPIDDQAVTEHSVTGAQYGAFLSQIFDMWVRRDVGRVFVQLFDVVLAAWSGHRPGLCIFEETCGAALAMEHTGDVYACDHFVKPQHHRGNMQITPLVELVNQEQQWHFGQAKRTALPRLCQECDYCFICNGGCPKNRIRTTPEGEPGLNILCDGYRAFFQHVDRPMRFMAAELRARRPPANIMFELAREETAKQRQWAGVNRNAPCPCGSGRKFKHCCGKQRR